MSLLIENHFPSSAAHMNQYQTLPSPIATAELRMRDGAIIRLRRYGKAGGLRIVISHGNGLASNAYAPFWLQLIDRFDVVLFDMRNHGQNPFHSEEAHIWESFYDDMEEIFQGIRAHFGGETTVGAFHSLSALVALTHTLRRGQRWDALCLFDPPIMLPESHALHSMQVKNMAEHSNRALRRVGVYNSPEELATLFRTREPFARWVPGSAELMARETLRRVPDGRWILSCPSACEARTFAENSDSSIFPMLATLPVPLKIIAGDPSSPHAIPASQVAKAAHEELGIDYAMIPDTTHFLQIEEPKMCHDLLVEFIERHGLSR